MANPSKSKSQTKSQSLRLKGSGLRSEVWEHFDKVIFNGEEKAICHGCGKKFVGSGKKGTSHLKTHWTKRCRKRNNRDVESNVMDLLPNAAEGGEITSINSVQTNAILRRYKEDKENFCKDASKLSCRFNLIIHAIRKFKSFCLCLVVYFIDDDWKLKKKIIAFKGGVSEYDLPAVISRSLSEWILKKNICSVFSSCLCPGPYKPELRNWLSNRNLLSVISSYSSDSDFSDNLKQFEQSSLRSLLFKIKGVSDYVLKKQILDMTEEKSEFKSLDNKSTKQVFPQQSEYKFGVVLEKLVGFKDEFCKLEQKDTEFKSKALTKEEWDGAIAIYEFLKGLYDVASNFSSKGPTTPNECFPKFCSQLMKLLEAEKSSNCYICKLGSALKPTFQRLWKESLLVLTIAVMLDPRFKMDIVSRWLIRLNGVEPEVNFQQNYMDVTEVYNKYARDFRNFRSSMSSSSDVSVSTSYKMLDDFEMPYMPSIDDVDVSSSELERYLNDPKVKRVEEFDILPWWRVNAQNYPVLAMMARDFLAVPISDFYFASITETEIEKIVQNTQYMDPDVREALICTSNQLETPPQISMAQDQTMKDNDLAIEKIQPVNSKPYLDEFLDGLRSYIIDIKDVAADGNCGFRVIANLMGFGENGWKQVRKDLLYELQSLSAHYLPLYGYKRVQELIKILAADGHGCEYWMTMPDMGHLIASCYNVVLFYLSSKQYLTFLPLRSLPLPLDSRKEIAMAFVNNNHFVEVVMSQNHPVPRIESRWSRCRDACAVGWEVDYTSRIEQFERLILPNDKSDRPRNRATRQFHPS